jgi:hypothetical protein
MWLQTEGPNFNDEFREEEVLSEGNYPLSSQWYAKMNLLLSHSVAEFKKSYQNLM